MSGTEKVELFSACQRGELETVRRLSDQVTIRDIRYGYSQSPLHIAAREGHLDVVRYLVTEADCDPDVRDDDQDTPLHTACRYGHLDMARFLVAEAKCDPSVKNKNGETSVQIACWSDHLDVVGYLVNEAHCDPNVKSKRGETPLHRACREGRPDTVRYLVTEAGCDPNARDGSEQTPLHWACRVGDVDVVKYLVTEGHSDPNATDNEGASPLHTASRYGQLDVVRYLVTEAQCDPNIRNKDEETPIHTACLSGHLDVVRYLVNEAHCDPNPQTNNGETPLHTAGRKGHLDIVRYLVGEASCDLNARDTNGYTPLHTACRFGCLNVVRYLVTDAGCDPNVRDDDGETLLHKACSMDHKGLVAYLLAECNADPNCTANNGFTPTSLAENTEVVKLLLQYGGVSKNLTKCLLAAQCSTLVPEPISSVFVVGDEGAGKSTLIKALTTEKKEGGRRGWRSRNVKVTGVRGKTAGVVNHEVRNFEMRSLSIYDLAGNRAFRSAHDTVARSSIKSAMFVLVVNLCAALVDLKQTVSYWISFVQGQVCAQSSSTSPVALPYLLAVGSHSDSVRSKPALEEKEGVVRSLCRDAQNLIFVEYFRVDCRYHDTPPLTQLWQQINAKHYWLKQKAPEVTFCSHTLYIYLVSDCAKKLGLRLGSLVKTIESDPLSWKERFLPQTLEEVHEACSIINDRGLILFIRTQPLENSWIVIDKDMLLRQVYGAVLSPRDFAEHKSLTVTGVVPFSKLCSTFAELIEAKKIDPQLIVDFLVHMEFCREIREDDLLKLVTQAPTEYGKERHFLFPALTQQSPPHDLWQSQPDQYSCCWVLRCLDHHYLSPRFHQVLLLRLAFEHSEAVEPHKIAARSPVLHQQCSVWRNGIKWTTDTSDVLVEVTDHSVVLFLSCRSDVGKELELVNTRAQLMKQVLKAKAEFCGVIKTVEEFIPHPQYPVNIPCTSVSVESIAQAICNGKDVQTSSRDLVPVVKLLHFESFQFCNLQCLVDLYCDELGSCKVTSSFIESVSSNITSMDDFCTVLNVPLHKIEVEGGSSDRAKAVRMFQEWQTQSDGTYQCLRGQMDKYSIFSGRNILEIAVVQKRSLPPPSRAVSSAALNGSIR